MPVPEKYVICNNSEVCPEHQLISELTPKLSNLEIGLESSFTKEALEEYTEARLKIAKALSIIKILEHRDLDEMLNFSDPKTFQLIRENLRDELKNLKDDVDYSSYIQLLVHYTTPQSYGGQVEKIYLKKQNLTKVSSSDSKGDAYDPVSKEHLEFKFSVAKFPDYRINLVQIRPHHNLDKYHILIFFPDDNRFELFILNKSQMKKEIELTGESLAHGSKNKSSEMTLKEYAIRFKAGSALHKRWISEYSAESPF